MDSGDRQDRLLDCKKELHALLKEERLAGASLLIFCNKQDLPCARSSKEIAQILELENIQTHHWSVVGCSAVTGDQLLEGMDWIVNDIASRIYSFD